MIKKILLFLLLLILVPLGILFFRPALIINPKNLAFVLHHTHVLKSWRWSEARFTHEWIKWNDRGFSGSFKNLCFTYGPEPVGLDTCLEDISWSIRLQGLHVVTVAPLVIDSSILSLSVPDKPKEKTPPPDIYKYWTMFWSDLVPDMDFNFHKIAIKDFSFDLKLVKTKKNLQVSALKFNLMADPDSFELKAPPKYPVPRKKIAFLQRRIYLRKFVLKGKVKKNEIPLALNGFVEGIKVNVLSRIDLPVKDDFSSIVFRKKAILNTNARIIMKDVKKNLSLYSPKPYDKLPAPFNVMNGDVEINVTTRNHPSPDFVNVDTVSSINLASLTQDFYMDFAASLPLDLRTFKPREINLDIDFKKVRLELPRLSRKSPPPQLLPDSRFKKQILPPVAKKTTPIDIDLKALNEKAMNITTNLLDEPLRLNFDLSLANGKMNDGFVQILPLKTTIFRRPIRLRFANIKFSADKDTQIDAEIMFPLPEYKITLKLEGPMSKPKYAFQSKPPLPEDDIYSVLLFGRPLQDLSTDDKSAAAKTNSILAQGILSLSVLYFLAGSPVEYVGYDTDSKSAVAQFGLSDKSSLRVGGGNEGVNSTTLRRTLGKGWYLDTSVQQSQEEAGSNPSETHDYGVLLERIISY